QDGSFAREWIEENEKGQPRLKKLREAEANHPIEKIGKVLRGMMPWLHTKKEMEA
ncbi:MAG TPA: ketol-acid reductoisomerase, partial [Calditrichae bacterium]|nr:ketol-acid reductoisomerase [Calditrichia bacterium]